MAGDQADDTQGDFDLPDGFQDDATAKLVARAKAGDTQALNDLFARYHALVLETARRRIGPRLRLKEDPDDLAQTTFREATRDLANYQYRGEGSLVRWLIQILQNKIRDKAEFYGARKRDAGRERHLVGAGDDPEEARGVEPAATDMTVTQHVSQQESWSQLRGALEHLSPEHRAAITAVFFEGKSLREAGALLGGKSEDAVRMMLRRAEARLHDILRGTLGKDVE
ncbi:MAG: polymerase sigma factor CarQ [Planctomycetota bacterium]|jgi:RNA polymerase sigma-70 factor (subfamily 1)